MTNRRQALGRQGESLAADFLCQKGYKEITRNLNLKIGEIDLLMEHNHDIIIVEVKTQTSATFTDPVSKLTTTKIRKLWQLARIISARYPNRNIRLEAVTLYWKPEAKQPTITLYPLTP